MGSGAAPHGSELPRPYKAEIGRGLHLESAEIVPFGVHIKLLEHNKNEDNGNTWILHQTLYRRT